MRVGTIYQTENGEFFSDKKFPECNPEPELIDYDTEPVHVLYGEDTRKDWSSGRVFDGGNPKHVYKYENDPLPEIPWQD